MTLMRYEPLSILNQLQRDVNRLFETTSRFGDEEHSHMLADWLPAIDIKEESDRFIIHADLPGVNINDIEITLEKGVLSLRGQRVIESNEQNAQFRRVERVRGTFLRRFSLPDVADADKVNARCKDGVLEVIVQKRETAKPKRINIEEN